MLKKILLLIAMLAVAVLGSVSYLKITEVSEPTLASARIYDAPRAIEPFILEGTRGAEVTESALQGQWTLLFTGYTFCPDICPTTMAFLKSRWSQLADATDFPVEVWMISVDPQRDDIERLGMYVNFFGDGFFGVRAEHKHLFPFVRNIGLMYSIPDEDETNYLVNHSSAIILVNPAGQQQAIFRPSHELGQMPTVNPNELVSDFGKIVRYLERVYAF
ncbi:SCO family protein [Aliidiomarina sanyensis]|uniref:SCO family protein n=1 Tax=Aliidiomarina sanyensis TaxID=1249555 RepID=A0A432WPJ3_9GAMM|nr:SCO family protein [Aliidiomarina sanyensis]RUO35658.1 SCO family protein [Aliidiomarina sanyensis]